MIVDSNAVSAWIGKDPGILRLLRTAVQVYLPVIVIGEYRFGILNSNVSNLLEAAWGTVRAVAAELPILSSTAEIYGQIRQEQRAKGRPIPDNDAWIAALAREHSQVVVTRDRHFREIDRIACVDW